MHTVRQLHSVLWLDDLQILEVKMEVSGFSMDWTHLIDIVVCQGCVVAKVGQPVSHGTQT